MTEALHCRIPIASSFTEALASGHLASDRLKFHLLVSKSQPGLDPKYLSDFMRMQFNLFNICPLPAIYTNHGRREPRRDPGADIRC